MGVDGYGVSGRTNNGKLEILVKVLNRDSNLPRANRRLKARIIEGNNETHKELKNKLRVE